MKRIASTLAYAAVILATSQLYAATLRLNAVAHATYNASDGGPATVPLITDEQGNILNPAVGQVYEILITMSIFEFVELPNGNIENGFAGANLQIQLDNLRGNLRSPGWNLVQENIDLRPGPGGCCVPLWLDLCNCGDGGRLDAIAVGIDVADFRRAAQIGNPDQDPRRTVGQGYPIGEGVLLGRIFVDYLGGFGSLQVSPDSFQVHDLENVYPASGTAIGDTLTFVPEPSSWQLLFLCMTAALLVTAVRAARERDRSMSTVPNE
jgi:hypothetical protein